MATQSLLHEILLALLGHTGACIAPLIEAETAADASSSASSSVSASAAPRFVVSGLVLAEEVPFVTPAERAAINQLLQAGFAYVRIMHFVQNIDAGATVRDRAAAGANTAQSDAFAATAAGTGEQSGGHVGLRTTLASTALEQRALDAQQARHVYAAAGAMFSPPKKQRPARDDEDEQERGNSMALVPLMEPLHPLLDTPVAQAAQPKAVGLYLRALGLGLEEVLAGYRALILKIEQDILAEAASDPSTAPPPAAAASTDGATQQQPPPRRIEYGLAKITLALRQYLVILPALQNCIATIASSKPSSAAAHSAAEGSPASSPNPATPVAESPSSSSAAATASSPSFHAHGIHGLRLLAYLSVSSQTGVPVLREVFASLLGKLRRVLHNQLQAWCFRGVLVDPFEEFFIQAEPTLAAATATASAVSSAVAFGGSASAAASKPLDWDRSYTLRLSQLPLDFLSELGGGGMATVHRVLFVGKAVLVLSAREAAEEAQRRKKQGASRAEAARRSSNAMWNAAAAAAATGTASATAQHSRIGSLSATPLNSNGGGLRTPLSVRSASATPRFEYAGAHANGTFARGFGAATASNTAAATPAVAPATPTLSLLAECQPLISAFQALQQFGSSSSGSGVGGPDFESLLHDLSRVVSRRLYLALLGPGCSLLTHLFLLKSFVLGGSGEFAGAFIDLAESGVIGGAGAAGSGSGSGYASGLFSRALTPQVLARMDRDLNGSNGPLKQSLAYAGCNLEYDSDEAANEWSGGGGGGGGLGGSPGSSREEAAALANYPVKHLTFHLSPDPAIAAAAAPPSILSPSAAAAAAAASGSSPPQSAWSLLRFEYRVSAPLDLIFLPAVMSQYNRLFRFLLQARRVQQSVQSLWQSSMRLKGSYTPRASAAVLPALLLRHSMSHFLDSLLSYLCVDVVGAAWSRLVEQIGATSEFEQVKRAHEQYVESITLGAFLRERVISGAISDLMDTCMLLVRSSSSSSASSSSAASVQSQSQLLSPSSPVFLRISGDFQRQLCFLHSLLVAKTDFGGGGSGGFRVASLVARLDYNGHITRLSSTLGLGRAQLTKLVPAAQGRGTVTSAAAIAQSMGRGVGPAATVTRGGSEVAATSSAASASQFKRSSAAPASSAAPPIGGARLAATQASFTPAHLAASSLTSQFAAGSTRPPAAPAAPRGGGGSNGGPTSY